MAEISYVVEHDTVAGNVEVGPGNQERRVWTKGRVVREAELQGLDRNRLVGLGAIRVATPEEAAQERVMVDPLKSPSAVQESAQKDTMIAAMQARMAQMERELAEARHNPVPIPAAVPIDERAAAEKRHIEMQQKTQNVETPPSPPAGGDHKPHHVAPSHQEKAKAAHDTHRK